MEQINGEGPVFATYHVSPANATKPCTSGPKQQSEGSSRLVDGFNTGFHEYAMERGTDFFAFVYDGVTLFNSSGAESKGLPVHDVPWYLILNFAIGGPWPKPVNAQTVFPAVTKVDYVRVSARV
jgi:hypothetical protein